MSILESLIGLGNTSFMKTIRDLAPLLTFGAQAAGQVMQYQAQKEMFSKQNRAINEASAQNQAALQERASQVTQANRESIGQRARAAMVERAKMAAIGNESGASGNTQDRLRNSVMANAGMDIANIESNEEAYQRQLVREMMRERASSNQMRSRLTKPSFLSTGLGILGAGVDYARQSAPARTTPGLQRVNY